MIIQCQYSFAEEIDKPYETPIPTILDNTEKNLRFIRLQPDLEMLIGETKYSESGLYSTDNSAKNLYTFDNHERLYALSSNGRNFVTGKLAQNDDLRYNRISQDLNENHRNRPQAKLKFFKEGNLIKQYHVQDLVTDLTQILVATDVSGYPWINKTKIDYEHNHLYLETVDNNLYVFALDTGEILSSTMFSLDNYAATIIKQDGTSLDVEQVHICDSIFSLIVETQNIDSLSIAGFLESEKKDKDNSTMLVAIPFQDIDSITRLDEDELIFRIALKKGSPTKLRLENFYQLCSIDSDKKRIRLSINEIASINSFKLLKSDEVESKYPKLTRTQLDFYKKGNPISPWERLAQENYTIIDYRLLNNAIKEGESQIVQKMLESGADANRKLSFDYRTRGRDIPLLNTASSTGILEIVKILVEHGADVNSISKTGKSSLFISIENNNYEITKYLIKNGADVNHKDGNGITPLYYAMEYTFKKSRGRSRARQKQQKLEDAIDKETATAINHKIIILLLESEADPNIIVGRNNQSALYLATQNHNTELVKLLLSHEADPNIADKSGRVPLYNAVSVDIVEILLEAGVNPNYKDKNKVTLLDILSMENNVKKYNDNIDSIVEILLKHGADSEYAIKGRYSPFENSLNRHDTSLIKLFIKYGADVNAFLKDKFLPIHKAAKGPTEMLNLLLEAGADPNKKTYRSSITALQSLCITGSDKIPDKPGPGVPQKIFDMRKKSMEDKCANIKILEKLDNEPESTLAFCKKANEGRPSNWKSVYSYCKEL